MKAGKVWGTTELIHANGAMEFHRIDIEPHTYCSKHKHSFKWNGFYVVSGALQILVWKNNYDLVDSTILYPGEFTAVAPGEYHQFKALEETLAFELYWAEFNHNDIQRESVGGKQ